MSAVRFEQVDVVFGPQPARALALLDAGRTPAEVFAESGHTVAVHGASLSVSAGEICVLMGLSGSGKSSLLRCVNGLNVASRGRVLVRDGDAETDVAACPPAVLRGLRRRRVAMVFQQFALMPWRTIGENVAFGLELRGVPKPERARTVARMLALVGLEAWRERYPAELSGGMQQRVGLARAFATDADVLLMDEPFSALDPLIRSRLQDELCDLQRRLGKTVLFVSHDLDEALKLGSTVAIMEAGRIVQHGPPAEIVTAPADAYVASFVAGVNPLAVLRGADLMTPLAALPQRGNHVAVGGGYVCRLDAAGRPQAVLCDGNVLAPTALASATPATTLRELVELRHKSGRPVLLHGGDGRLVGAVDANQILAGLRGQSNAQPPPEPLPAQRKEPS